MTTPYDAVVAAMTDYFDGLYHSDTTRLGRVFHPEARYVCSVEGDERRFDMAEYFAVVDKRPSPASRDEHSADRIVSIEFGGPRMAFVKAECAIGRQRFTDFLTFIHDGASWRIISKVFHYDLAPEERN